ncbi:MmgE/PrpD family protein [Peptoniphilus sp.]|jgi:2-methylcitrate dehydratase PrpD|uniref:MmgE/PrpD family protein n=1 Tax=Peptoniphilus sp. TaxID=1971214 RepID=UPI003D918132
MDFNFNRDFKVEKFILETKWEDLPEDVKKQAILCSVDLFNALILGSMGEQFKVGLEFSKDFYKDGAVKVIGTEDMLNLPGAVVAMAHSSNSFDIDDGYNLIKGHPGTSFIAGLLAASSFKNVSYKKFLEALVICYEVGIRAGLAIQDHYDYLHSTGTYGAVGTAVGMSKIIGLNKKQINNALSIAEFHAPLTPVMRSVQHPSMNKDGVPFGGLVGMQAVLETLYGSTGVGYLLELPEYSNFVETLGKEFIIKDLYFKPYTCCRWAHQPITAGIDLINDNNIDYKDIKKVNVYTFSSAAQLSKIKPKTTDEAQYNIAWPVAAALVHKDVGINQVKESALDDAEVLAMMDKLFFKVDPKMEEQFPEKRLAWMEIITDDDKVYKSEVYQAPGEHTDNIDIDWIEKKFIKRTEGIIDSSSQKEILDILKNNLDINVNEIIDLINKKIVTKG